MKRRFGRYVVETSREDKVLYPEAGLSKGEVMDYYHDVFELMLPHLKGRYLTLHRFPDGIDGDGFYQQQRSDHFPDFVGGHAAPRAGGQGSVHHILAENRAALVYLGDQGALALHGWLSRSDAPDRPDRMVFDLDPPGDDFGTVVQAARRLREVLQLGGLRPYVMTTGSRGMHVVAPLDRSLSFDEARKLARRLAGYVAERFPERFTLEQRKKARKGRLYLDIGRNAYGQTGILPYSPRALPGAPVATPLGWDELGRRDIGPRRFHLRNLRRRLGQKRDPWRGFRRHARRPSLAERKLESWAAGG